MGGGGRFIPAHAENTIERRSRFRRRTVHPRARGEHGVVTKRVVVPSGSSPRTRRTQISIICECSPIRFIPAHAENTSFCPARARWRSVHPRARGEHAPCRVLFERAHGSSPRTRRTRAISLAVIRFTRFIPAHAENTNGAGIGDKSETVHPRARGEHSEAGESVG